jgi:transcriptional regulator with XRE-family HTH domain
MGLGKQIRKYREKAGWTLEQLSERAEVDVGTISALEQRDSLRTRYSRQLAEAFGLTIEQLSDESQAYPLFARGAKQVNSVVGIYQTDASWPFSLSYARYQALPARDKGRIDGFMLALADAYEEAVKKTSGAG